MDGIEWMNADSEWRNEGRLRLSRAVLAYWWRPAGALASLLDRPSADLEMWDRLGATRRVVGLAAQDAHGGFGPEANGSRGRRLHLPSYDASFRMFSTYVQLPTAPASPGSAASDAAALLAAIRAGSAFTAVDALAAPASLDFRARAQELTAQMGEELPVEAGRARFTVRAAVPAGATTSLLRNGRAIAQAGGGVLDQDASLPGVYRVEIHVPSAPGAPPVPWVVSNPIYRWARGTDGAPAPPAPPAIVDLDPLDGEDWTAEASPLSPARVTRDGESARLEFQLQPGTRASQFAALATRLSNTPGHADVLRLRGHASRPMRVSVQLRFGGRGEVRWGRSIYLDGIGRDILVPLDRLRPEGAAGARPPISEATSLLLVVDLTNAAPGAGGSFTVGNVRFGRLGP
jgi:hypothetical protein